MIAPTAAAPEPAAETTAPVATAPPVMHTAVLAKAKAGMIKRADMGDIRRIALSVKRSGASELPHIADAQEAAQYQQLQQMRMIEPLIVMSALLNDWISRVIKKKENQT